MINKHHDGTISLKNLDCNEFVKKKLIFLRNNFSVPNLLISGPPGSGKSTAGKFFGYYKIFIFSLNLLKHFK